MTQVVGDLSLYGVNYLSLSGSCELLALTKMLDIYVNAWVAWIVGTRIMIKLIRAHKQFSVCLSILIAIYGGLMFLIVTFVGLSLVR